jgi:hypothetical protein
MNIHINTSIEPQFNENNEILVILLFINMSLFFIIIHVSWFWG